MLRDIGHRSAYRDAQKCARQSVNVEQKNSGRCVATMTVRPVGGGRWPARAGDNGHNDDAFVSTFAQCFERCCAHAHTTPTPTPTPRCSGGVVDAVLHRTCEGAVCERVACTQECTLASGRDMRKRNFASESRRAPTTTISHTARTHTHRFQHIPADDDDATLPSFIAHTHIYTCVGVVCAVAYGCVRGCADAWARDNDLACT